MTFARITKGRTLLVAVPALLLAASLVASYLTRDAMQHRAFVNGPGSGSPDLVDQRPWQTAAGVAPLAITAEEQAYALQAERLADHEVDQAFAMALRQAEMQTHTLQGRSLALQQKVNELQATVKDDQSTVDSLTARLAAVQKRGDVTADSISNDLDAAKSQLQLDSDELSDANDDLARSSGDMRGQIQQQLTAREDAMKKYDAQMSGGEIAVISVRRYGTLAGRVGGWFNQRTRTGLLQQAKAETDADVAALSAQYQQIQQQSSAVTQKIAGASGSEQDATAKKASRIGQVHELAQIHSILADRIETEQQLSGVYGKWIAQVALQHRIVLHLILQSLSEIAGILLFAVGIWWMVQALLDRTGVDARSEHTLRTIATLGIELVTLAVVLVAIFGAPRQMPTILGLGAAGLTVVFQDFILAFFGWFVLMGRNGIRPGDWVEINGVGGEVIEVGLFRTTLLETGNWTDKGHPTGRRVMFMNSFAVTGQFFNFSSAGQWMWDEISLNVAGRDNLYQTIEAIQKAVESETEKDAKLAETEWKSTSKARGLSHFPAATSVDLRPASSGIDVLVRYVTRAGDRFETRNRLYGTLMTVLHGQEQKATGA